MKLKWLLSIYILLIFVFWLIYNIIYRLDSTSFVFEKQYNQRTLDIMNVWEYLDNPVSINLNLPDDIYEFNQSIKPLSDSLNLTNEKIKELEKEQHNTKHVLDSIYKIFEESRSQDIEQKLSLYIKQEKDTLQRIQDILNIINIILEQDSINDGYTIAKSRLLVDKFNLKYRIAIKEAEFRTKVLENYGSFGDRKSYNQVSELVSQDRILADSSFHLKTKYNDLKREIAHKIIDFHNKRINQVGCLDFLYFSAMTSFSSSFGDIIPNNFIARLFITIHVISSIILIAFIIERLSRRYNNEE